MAQTTPANAQLVKSPDFVSHQLLALFAVGLGQLLEPRVHTLGSKVWAGIEHGKGILKRVGFQKENLKEEFYWVPSKAARAIA